MLSNRQIWRAKENAELLLEDRKKRTHRKVGIVTQKREVAGDISICLGFKPDPRHHRQICKDFSNSLLWFSLVVQLKFAVLVEKDEDGYYLASVPELPGCHTQARTLDELTRRIREAIEAYLEAEGSKSKEGIELVGFQFVEVPARSASDLRQLGKT